MRTSPRSFVGLVFLAPAALYAQAAPRAPIQTAPGLTVPMRPSQTQDFAGRYEHTEAGGQTWTLVLETDGTGNALLNGQPARDSSGQFVTFRYRVTGGELYISSPHTASDDVFGSFDGTTLTTVGGWRYDKR